jgi:hypothetical protein
VKTLAKLAAGFHERLVLIRGLDTFSHGGEV